MGSITYLAWQLDKRQPVARQIAAAVRRFEERCGCAPAEMLVPAAPNGHPGLEWPGLTVREGRNIPAGQVWLGADLDRVLATLAERVA